MNLIETIWTSLTTENILLTNILFIPEVFLEIFINMLLFTTLLNISYDKVTKRKYIIILSVIVNLSTIFIPNPYCSCINLVIQLILVYLFFKVSILKSALSCILPLLITVLCESLIIKVFTSYFNFDMTHFINYPFYRLVFALLIQFSVFIVYLFIKYFKIQISILENMSKKSKIIFFINLAFAIIAIIIQFLITGFYINKLPIYIVILSNISLISYFLLSIYSLTKTTQFELTTLNLEQEKEYNKTLKSLQDDLHGFRHDFSNIMCTIGGYVQVSDMNGLSNYYSQIQQDITKLNNLGSLNPDMINNPAIYTLISSKYDIALNLGIEMNINVFLNLDTLNMKIYEFTRILGILLDNAIEATRECQSKIINLEIRKDSKHNRQILLIENTYKDKEINLDKIFDKNFSTKPKNSGLGLWEVRQILKRNTNLNLFTTKDNKFFKQQLEMYDN